MSNRPSIPEKLKRKVRQRCGFGCIICGLPIYEYDHIVEYSKTKHHKEDELTLLCPNHHSMKTKKLLSYEQIVKANKNPFNLRSGHVKKFTFEFLTESPKFILGEQSFINSNKIRPTILAPISIYEKIPFSFYIDTQGVMLSLEAQDENGKTLLIIKESEVTFSINNWDATFIGSTLKIWDESEKFVLELQHLPPNAFRIIRYNFYSNGFSVNIVNNIININSNNKGLKFQLSGDGTVDANIGVQIGENHSNLSVGIQL